MQDVYRISQTDDPGEAGDLLPGDAEESAAVVPFMVMKNYLAVSIGKKRELHKRFAAEGAVIGEMLQDIQGMPAALSEHTALDNADIMEQAAGGEVEKLPVAETVGSADAKRRVGCPSAVIGDILQPLCFHVVKQGRKRKENPAQAQLISVHG